MLTGLRISGFGVIEEAEVSFGPGLTVLTGETGAGKSMLAGALGLLVGGRADCEAVRAGREEAEVDGLFARSPLLGERLAGLGLPDLGEEISVRRVVGRGGRGKAYVNGALVTVGVLGQLMRGVVDIAGQHEHVALFDPGQHRAVLDRAGALEALLLRYRGSYQALRQVEQRLLSLGGDERGFQARAEFLRFQVDELDRLAPAQGEEVRLDEERRRLAGAEKLRRAVSEAESLVLAQEGASLDTLGRAIGLLGEAGRLDGSLAGVVSALQSVRVELEEAARSMSRYLGSLEADPARLQELDERVDLLRRVARKHGVASDELVARRQALADELALLENRRGHLEALGAEREQALRQAREAAGLLTEARREVAGRLSSAVREGLANLAMPKAELEVGVRPSAELGPEGADEVEMLFTANPGEPLRPLSKVASGGEASRVLLALKRALASSDAGGCYVLDEADAGVGGAVAEVVGRMIKEVSLHRQVLCITHLPQVAAFADAHLLVQKDQRKGRTHSRVRLLEAPEARTQELARMLSGVEVTREALGAAQALIRSAERAMRRRVERPPRTDARVRRSA